MVSPILFRPITNSLKSAALLGSTTDLLRANSPLLSISSMISECLSMARESRDRSSLSEDCSWLSKLLRWEEEHALDQLEQPLPRKTLPTSLHRAPSASPSPDSRGGKTLPISSDTKSSSWEEDSRSWPEPSPARNDAALFKYQTLPYEYNLSHHYHSSGNGTLVILSLECLNLLNVADVVLDFGEGGQCLCGNGVS